MQNYNYSVFMLSRSTVDSSISVAAEEKLLVNCLRICPEPHEHFAAIVEPHSLSLPS